MNDYPDLTSLNLIVTIQKHGSENFELQMNKRKTLVFFFKYCGTRKENLRCLIIQGCHSQGVPGKPENVSEI